MIFGMIKKDKDLFLKKLGRNYLDPSITSNKTKMYLTVSYFRISCGKGAKDTSDEDMVDFSSAKSFLLGF